MAEFRMPALGADMTEGTLSEWLLQPGDRVSRGDIVAVVETAKAAIEVECFDSGVVERLLVEPGTTVPVGEPLAVIATSVPEAAPVVSPLVRHLAAESGVDLATVHGTGPGGRITRADVMAEPSSGPPAAEATGVVEPAGVVEQAAPRGSSATAPASATTPPSVTAASSATTPPSVTAPSSATTPPSAGPATGAAGRRVRATPLARRLAAEAGVDLATLTGTGAKGAVRAADIRSVLDVRPVPSPVRPHPAPVQATHPAPVAASERQQAMRRATGDLMARSKREIPHYYLSTTVDLAAATRWLRELNLRLPVAERLVPAALLLKAAALAAREVPQLNGFWTASGFTPAPAVHLGVAVSLRGGGLVAPAIHDAADLPVPELMARLRDLVARARGGRLRGSETADPTITVTSLGDQGVEAVFGVIHPPQVALVGLGRVVERPWAAGGMLGVRPVVTATLSADHRASDGATGARYLAALDRLLQRPEEL